MASPPTRRRPSRLPVKPWVNAPLLAIVGEGLLSRLSFGLIGFTLPLYARHLGLTLTEVGILAALNSAVALAAKPLLGWVADRFGLKRTFVAAIGLRSLVSLLLGFASAPWELYAIRTTHGVSMSLRDPSVNALIAEHGGAKSVASAFAWYQTARTVAGSVSRALAGILLTLTAANYPLVFFVAFALSVLPLLVVSRWVQEESATSHANGNPGSSQEPLPQRTPNSASAGRSRPKLLPFVGLGFLIAGTAEMLNGLFPVLATEYAGLSPAQAGIVYAVSTLATIFSGPVFGWLSDNVSRKLVLMVRGVANTLSSILYVAAPTFAGIAVAKTADDMGKAAFRPAWGALMAHISSFDKRNRARTMSWMSMAEDAGGVVGPVLAGLLWSTWGIIALMGVRVVLAIVTEVYAVSITAWQNRASGRAPALPDNRVGPASHSTADG
ncbi:MAG: MFS transporter [Candidatus Rokuibacteriota bacterium]|nr:MAG: MFS transporter [Candidatus Rokubacteria bacterium]